MTTLREQLIGHMLRLNGAQLAAVAECVNALECGDPSPLSTPSPAEPARISDDTASTDANSGGSAAKHSGEGSPHSKDWPHAPLHRLTKDGTYIVTGGTLHKKHLFGDPRRLDYLDSTLLNLAKQHGWRLEAWAVFSNHYHFVAHAMKDCLGLDQLLSHLHRETAIEVNRWDQKVGRQVWFNFWDTKLTYERSYLARLNYVHQNAVKHGLVAVANQYQWCSAAWFEQTARRAQVQTIYSFKTDKVKVRDDYDPTILGVR